MDEVEYLENIEYLQEYTQQDIYQATTSNAKNNYSPKNRDKKNTPTATYNLDENSNDNYAATPIIKRKKRKSKVESTLQPTEILADVAKKTYEMQNSYYENKIKLKKQELECKKRLVDAVEKCNPS